MKTILRLSIIVLLFSCSTKGRPHRTGNIINDCTGEFTTEEIQDTLVSAFLDLIMH